MLNYTVPYTKLHYILLFSIMLLHLEVVEEEVKHFKVIFNKVFSSPNNRILYTIFVDDTLKKL